ncbi:unnamed protein product [Amoebophrya sp. A25]|nr:unnamed protein product [Amoebophrya sp. A25]|eukprot:GSA25T00026117001.1
MMSLPGGFMIESEQWWEAQRQRIDEHERALRQFTGGEPQNSSTAEKLTGRVSSARPPNGVDAHAARGRISSSTRPSARDNMNNIFGQGGKEDLYDDTATGSSILQSSLPDVRVVTHTRASHLYTAESPQRRALKTFAGHRGRGREVLYGTKNLSDAERLRTAEQYAGSEEDAELVQQLINEVWSLNSALRTCENQITALLDQEQRLAYVAEIERETIEAKQQAEDAARESKLFEQENERVVSDLKIAEEAARGYLERISTLDAENAQLDSDLREAQQKLVAAEATHSRELTNLRSEQQLAILELDKQHAAVHRDHEQKVLDMHRTMARASSESQAQLNRIQANHVQEVAALRAQFQKDKAALLEFNKDSVLEVEDAKQQALFDMRSNYSTETQKRIEELERLGREKELAATQDKKKIKELEIRLAELQEKVQASTECRKSIREEEQKSAQQEISRLRISLADAQSTKEEAQTRRETIEAQSNRRIEALEEVIAGTKSQLAEAEKNLEKTRAQLAETQAGLRQTRTEQEKADKGLEEEKKQFEEEKAQIEKEHGKEIAELKEHFTSQMTEHEKEFDRQMALFEARIAECTQEASTNKTLRINSRWTILTAGLRFRRLAFLATDDMLLVVSMVRKGKRRLKKAHMQIEVLQKKLAEKNVSFPAGGSDPPKHHGRAARRDVLQTSIVSPRGEAGFYGRPQDLPNEITSMDNMLEEPFQQQEQQVTDEPVALHEPPAEVTFGSSSHGKDEHESGYGGPLADFERVDAMGAEGPGPAVQPEGETGEMSEEEGSDGPSDDEGVKVSSANSDKYSPRQRLQQLQISSTSKASSKTSNDHVMFASSLKDATDDEEERAKLARILATSGGGAYPVASSSSSKRQFGLEEEGSAFSGDGVDSEHDDLIQAEHSRANKEMKIPGISDNSEEDSEEEHKALVTAFVEGEHSKMMNYNRSSSSTSSTYGVVTNSTSSAGSGSCARTPIFQHAKILQPSKSSCASSGVLSISDHTTSPTCSSGRGGRGGFYPVTGPSRIPAPPGVSGTTNSRARASTDPAEQDKSAFIPRFGALLHGGTAATTASLGPGSSASSTAITTSPKKIAVYREKSFESMLRGPVREPVKFFVNDRSATNRTNRGVVDGAGTETFGGSTSSTSSMPVVVGPLSSSVNKNTAVSRSAAAPFHFLPEQRSTRKNGKGSRGSSGNRGDHRNSSAGTTFARANNCTSACTQKEDMNTIVGKTCSTTPSSFTGGTTTPSTFSTQVLQPQKLELTQIPKHAEVHLRRMQTELEAWRASMAQTVEDEFLALSESEWEAPLSRELIGDLWQHAHAALVTLNGRWVQELCCESNSFLEAGLALRNRLRSVYEEAWRACLLGEEQIGNCETGRGDAALAHYVTTEFLPSVGCCFQAGSAMSCEGMLAPINEEQNQGQSRLSSSTSTISSLSAEARRRQLLWESNRSCWRRVRKRKPLDLWRDALLLQPAVDDFAQELLHNLNRLEPTRKRLRRTYALSKPLARGLEKLAMLNKNSSTAIKKRTTSSSAEIIRDQKQSQKILALNDIARARVVVASLADVIAALEWLRKDMANAVQILQIRNRCEKPTMTGWRDVLLYLFFRAKPDAIFELQFVHYRMAAADQRRTDDFARFRLLEELGFCTAE